MRVMVMIKASPSSEAGKLPDARLLNAMGRFNEQLVDQGVLLAGDGLKPSRDGYRVRFAGASREVRQGPFPATDELLAGYWIWKVRDMDEAIDWVKRCPTPMEEDFEIEIRTVYEAEDFAEVDGDGETMTQENRLKQRLALQAAKAHSYLFFSGRCEEALDYYRAHLGATIEFIMRFDESPEPLPQGTLAPGLSNKIMHCEFTLGGMRIMASDGCDSSSQIGGFSLALALPDKSSVQDAFKALADGGQVRMPLTATFWSPLYGQVTDRFGVAWMVMLDGEQGP